MEGVILAAQTLILAVTLYVAWLAHQRTLPKTYLRVDLVSRMKEDPRFWLVSAQVIGVGSTPTLIESAQLRCWKGLRRRSVLSPGVCREDEQHGGLPHATSVRLWIVFFIEGLSDGKRFSLVLRDQTSQKTTAKLDFASKPIGDDAESRFFPVLPPARGPSAAFAPVSDAAAGMQRRSRRRRGKGQN